MPYGILVHWVDRDLAAGGMFMPHQWSRRDAVKMSVIAAGGALAGPAQAAAWPTRPVRIFCALPPGGITDLYARAYGNFIAETTQQNVIVENKIGGGGAIAAQALKAAPADGHRSEERRVGKEC